ncbi:MAG TPA: alpha/beta hydrolase [Ornithinimicrobium sp.]|uniref:alpha/beta fold hydrolase n=1 Tax=Ornithinimicrobium sp. TaxID=1977084 RepID=UPI002B470C75|nr:alpha/beta hydrolase [Ornithinimicrobium sp.]HKJ13133.1 alpha/beta hydrolase [Ornithinimicrobium sp.]
MSPARFVDADDGVRLHVELEPAVGSTAAPRPTLVLCHGYTLDRRCWTSQRRALSQAGYPVVVWDQRGHGRSGTGEASSYSIDQLGRDLAAVVEEVVPAGPVVLVGHSMGGMAIMAMAGQGHHDVLARVVAVAFLDSSAGDLHRVDWGLGALVGGWVNRHGPTVTAGLAPHQRRVRAAFARYPWLVTPVVAASSFGSRVSPEVARLTARMMLDTDFTVTAEFAPTLTAHDQRGAVSALAHLPALVMVGDRDVLTPPDHSDDLARSLPLATHVVVSRAGHIMMLEHPELVNDRLLAWCRSVEDPPKWRAVNAGVPQRAVDLRPGRGRAALTTGRPT